MDNIFFNGQYIFCFSKNLNGTWYGVRKIRPPENSNYRQQDWVVFLVDPSFDVDGISTGLFFTAHRSQYLKFRQFIHKPLIAKYYTFYKFKINLK